MYCKLVMVASLKRGGGALARRGGMVFTTLPLVAIGTPVRTVSPPLFIMKCSVSFSAMFSNRMMVNESLFTGITVSSSAILCTLGWAFILVS